MSDEFPILELHSDSPDVIEQLGSKEKFWFRWQEDEQPWLFKFTRENTGEDWSEKIASEIAAALEIPAARVELARFLGRRGCASRSFVRTKEGFDLIHGSEALAGRVLGYDRGKVRGQCDHSMRNIIAVIENTFSGTRQRVAQLQLRTLAGFIVLDALICNTDRHHDNWGLLRGPGPSGKTIHEVAPSFDHASSLGRELRDERRRAMLAEGAMARYALKGKGRGGIFWDEQRSRGERPMDLVIKAVAEYRDYFDPWLERLRELPSSTYRDIVSCVPSDWMSDTAKEFCSELLTVTSEKLKSL
jgi:hypothetical protein